MKIINKVFVFVCVFITVQNGRAQDFPTNAEPGRCYAKCLILDQYETITEEVLVSASSKRIEQIPATYKTIKEAVLVKEASKRVNIIPAEFETIEETIMISPEKTQIQEVPAEYAFIEEKVLIKEATTNFIEIPAEYQTIEQEIQVKQPSANWEKKMATDCQFSNTDDCMVWCLVNVPAEFVTISKQVLLEPSKIIEETVPAIYEVIQKKVMVQPTATKEVIIPAQYQKITKQILVKPATVNEYEEEAIYENITKNIIDRPAKTIEVEIPAQYKTFTKTVLKNKGGYTEWKVVLCDDDKSSSTILQIQEALTKKGYLLADRIIVGDEQQTMKALVKYQSENNLPTGQLDFETLASLGVSY